jgi:hypothetical protein
MEAFPPVRRLLERGLLKPGRLGDEPMRCNPLSNRCLPLSLGAMGMASVGVFVPGVDAMDSRGCSTTTESMESGSILEMGQSRRPRQRFRKRPFDVQCVNEPRQERYGRGNVQVPVPEE